MRIGIDISSVVYHTGVSYYTSNLSRALLALAANQEDEYTLFGSSLRHREELYHWIRSLSYPSRVNIFPFPPRLTSFLFNQLHHILPIESLIGNIDIFHSWDWYIPWTKTASLVTTIHDLAILKFPQTTHPQILKQHRQSWKWIKKEAQSIIAVSQATKTDIIEQLNIPSERIHVVYEALPQEVIMKIDENDIKIVKQKYSITKPYFLILGTLEPRKNIPRMIKAWQSFKSEYQLVVAGKTGGESIKPESDLILTGPLTDREIAILLKSATCLLYVSLYEGFGLPILEAFYYQTPVVTSNISSLPEVSGGAAVLVNPLEVDSIIQGIIIACRDRSRLVLRGQKRLTQFSWDQAAIETRRVYDQAIAARRKV